MATETQIVREAPEIEKRRIGLLDSAKIIADQPLALPGFAVAGEDPLTTAAIGQAQNQAGIGGYQPLLGTVEAGLGTVGEGIASLIPGVGEQVSAGQDVLRGGIGQFDPATTKEFMNPFEAAAVQQALADIRRAGDVQATQLGGRTAQAGAFGGSRQAILESELGRNILEQQGRTAAQMRLAGFESAAQRAQQAFEAAKARQLQAGSAIGQLGLQGIQQQAGLLGQQSGLLGQQAALADQRQQLALRDIDALRQLGAERRALAQAQLEAGRQSTLQTLFEPYQRVAFLSDIYKGAPSSQMSFANRASPQTSPGERILGLGIAGLAAAGGAAKTGLFG